MSHEKDDGAPSRRDLLAIAAGLTGLAGAGAAAAADLRTPVQPRDRRATAGRFDNKVVLITGATSGIGRASAMAFALEGAKVMFCGRRESLGAEVQAAIRTAGGDATYMKADVREDAEVAALVTACVRTYGGLDIAFNNAGIGAGGGPLGPTFNWERHNAVMDTNLSGVIRGMNHEIPAIRARGGGSIINTASVLAHLGTAGANSYAMSKAGVFSVTKSVALQVARDNIRVNSISPGPINTPMMGGGAAQASGAATPSRRAGEPEEIARVAMFLASDDAAYMTGEDVRVDGGSLAGR